ncbi:MAG: hypothetical protein WDO68_28210 [Gammaproteobacteria bacterium]
MLPQLALSAAYTYFHNVILHMKDFSSISVGFTRNLFDGGRARSRNGAAQRKPGRRLPRKPSAANNRDNAMLYESLTLLRLSRAVGSL